MPVTTRELTPDLWPDLERLFGSRGACGGCWCMHWRLEKGERWEELKGAPARARLHALVQSGRALGVLAYDGDLPVGWAALGPRRDFARLDRAPSFACDDADDVWSVPCFFVERGHRGQGVATALLGRAIEAISRRGGRVVEGYPIKPQPPGRPAPAAFAWTGTRTLFTSLGFRVVGNEAGGKQRVRRLLPARPA